MKRTHHAANRAGSTRIYYDSLPIYPWSYPLSLQITNKWERSAPKFASFSGNLATVQMAFRVDSGTIHEGLSFSSWMEFKSWVDRNIPNDGSNFSHFCVDLYDEVDTQIPKLNRMYGMNRLFSQYAGRMKYRTAYTGVGCTSRGMNYLLMKLWHHQHPWSVGWLDMYPWIDHLWNRCVWSNRKELRRYGITPVGHSDTEMYTIRPTAYGSSSRYYVCDNYDGVNPVLPRFASQPCVIENTRLVIYRGTWPISEGTTDYSIYNVYGSEHERRHARTELTGTDSSALLFSRVRLPNTGDGNWAMYVKPVGIDTIYLNYFDVTRYILEAVFFNKTRQIEFRDITSLITRQDISSDTTQIPKSSWIFYPYSGSNIRQKKSHLQPFMARFRLRDRATGKVGELSQSCVRPGKEHKFVPLSWITEPVI